MARPRTVWRCQSCGASVARWQGTCPDCDEVGTLVEEAAPSESRAGAMRSAPQAHAATPVRLSELEPDERGRLSTGIVEFDRVLGGGFVAGSLVLLGGEPGIGKSTLLLQAADSLVMSGQRVLYVCGEESPTQVRLRAERLGAAGSDIALLAEIDMSVIEATALAEAPDLMIVDSIQTAYDPELTGAPGSVGQVRACTSRLMRLAKDHGVTIVIVGHVTKEGAIAGPRVLEHMVDTVLYFEGDRDHAFRIVRAVKNRFGSVSEIGIFEMTEDGLVGVGQPSAALLAYRADGAPGSVVMAAMEGTRPLLVEVQALVTPTYLQLPRRLATGFDQGRVLQVLAVLERHGGLGFGQHDVYVSAAGGVRLTEPGVDLALALALASARSGTPVPASIVAFGEIGLTGEIRSVAHGEARAREAHRMGFETVVTGRGPESPAGPGRPVQRFAKVREALAFID